MEPSPPGHRNGPAVYGVHGGHAQCGVHVACAVWGACGACMAVKSTSLLAEAAPCLGHTLCCFQVVRMKGPGRLCWTRTLETGSAAFCFSARASASKFDASKWRSNNIFKVS